MSVAVRIRRDATCAPPIASLASLTASDQTTLRHRAHRAIPAGCHTYSKGDDQFPANAPAFIESGSGCMVTDPDGNTFVLGTL